MTQFSSDSYCSSKACGTHARVGTRACGPKARRGAARMRSISTRMCLLAATCAWAGQPAEAACGQLMCVPHACRRPYSWPPMLGCYEHASDSTAMRQRSMVAVAQHSVVGGCVPFVRDAEGCARSGRALRVPKFGDPHLPIWGPTELGPSEIRGPPPLGSAAGPSPRLGWDRSAQLRACEAPGTRGGSGWMDGRRDHNGRALA